MQLCFQMISIYSLHRKGIFQVTLLGSGTYNEIYPRGGCYVDNNLFKGIEKKTGVNMKDVFELANSMQNANFKDEKTVRNLVSRVATLANKKVPKELEDKIVHTLINGNKPVDMGTISKMLNEKKK